MPGMSEAVARARFLTKFYEESQKDAAGKKNNPVTVWKRLDQMRSALKAKTKAGSPRYKLEDVAVAFRLCEKNDEFYQHLQTHWFNAETGWWSAEKLQPIEPIIREGLIAAFDVALKNYDDAARPRRAKPLPIAMMWECRGNEVHVFVSWTKHQVSAIIHTPPPPAPWDQADPNATAEESLFVVRLDEAGGVVRKRPRYNPSIS